MNTHPKTDWELDADSCPEYGWRHVRETCRRIEFTNPDFRGGFDDFYTFDAQIAFQRTSRSTPIFWVASSSNLDLIPRLNRGESVLFVHCDNGAPYGYVVGQIWG